MTFSGFFVLFGIALGALALAFAGIGVGIFLGRRKTVQGCACEFNAEKARADRRGGRCGRCAGGAPPTPADAP